MLEPRCLVPHRIAKGGDRIERRLARVERQNRILIGLLCAMAVVASITATRAAPNVIVADEVRAQRFTLLDPHGGVADNWYADDRGGQKETQNSGGGYSGSSYHAP
jgi:hypothetical protein